ncbi:MAG: hypothetical protein VYE40_02905 [Myxococcota bacterium]|nr:hypothetical protein [Myxococcota bacterium]MEC9440033.1 hypothetical protein [Myxococcota bacterium]
MSGSHWLAAYEGFGALLDEDRLAQRGVSWVGSEHEARQGAPSVEHMPMGTLWSQGVWDLNVEMTQNKIRVANGGYTLPNGMGVDLEPAWYIDQNNPDVIWLAASSSVPPAYWIDVELSADAMIQALESLMPPPEEAPRKEIRAIMGYEQELAVPNVYSGELEEASPEALTNFWIFSPFRFAVMNGWSTYFSRSWAGYDMHAGGLYVWNVDYVPAKHHRVIERISQAHGLPFPEDMPLDLVGVLVGFQFATRELLQNEMEDAINEEYVGDLLVSLAALRYDELGLEEFVRPYMSHEREDVRRAAIHVCYAYGLGDLMQEAIASEPIEELRTFLEAGPADDAPILWELPWG